MFSVLLIFHLLLHSSFLSIFVIVYIFLMNIVYLFILNIIIIIYKKINSIFQSMLIETKQRQCLIMSH